jgi:putative MFS transporter
VSRICVVIDGATIMDANPGQWTETPPGLDVITKAERKEPWMIPIMAAIAEAAVKAHTGQPQRDTTITVTTRTDGWNLNVETE